MRFVRVGDLAEIAGGERVVAEIDEHEILVLSLEGCIYAISNICTHDEVWLDDGILHPGSCEIECPMHEGRFDLRTGAATHDPCEVAVATYPVKLEGGDVLVGIE